MAANTNTPTKRKFISYVRDGIKSQYPKQDNCQICRSSNELELHHYHTVALLVGQYLSVNNLSEPDTEAEALALRQLIYEAHWDELVNDTVTLCVNHHKELHKIYGVAPPLRTSEQQKGWVLKRSGAAPSAVGRFSKFRV